MDFDEGNYENKSAFDPYKFTPFISGTPPQQNSAADDNYSTVPTKP
jgi:hypothetical protein